MKLFSALCVLAITIAGCSKADVPGDASSTAPPAPPTFSLATSEYPSWSVFTVAAKAGLINGEKGGKPGEYEEKWNVDIVLEVKEYDPCLVMYGQGVVDAVCMTNTDALNPAMQRNTVGILPTSTSAGADKVITVGINSVEELKGQKVYGLAKSVSEYAFIRCLEKQGLNPADYKFENLEPSAAATALQTGSNNVKAICVWNPFAMQTLRTNSSAKDLFNTALIKGEIVDGVYVAAESLKRDGGDRFACCICDIYYMVSKMLQDPNRGEQTRAALGEDFAHLSASDMVTILVETEFYGTPQAGIDWYSSSEFHKIMTDTVVPTCEKMGSLASGKPKVGFGDPEAQLNYDTQYMKRSAFGK